MKHYVYNLQSLSLPKQIYIGITSDLERLLKEHNSGKSVHTNKYRPWKLAGYVYFNNVSRAKAFERYLKTGSGRAFIQRHFLA